MMIRRMLLLLFTVLCRLSEAQGIIVLKTATAELEGTLTVPESASPVPVVLLIAGSGPTDRDGNNTGTQSNCYKYLAEELSQKGYAMLRYDKRGVGKSDMGVETEADIRLGHFVEDARLWIEHLSLDKRFSRIIVAGHSEGSLIGMLALQKTNKASAFISIAGPGRPLDEILKEQLSGSPENIRTIMYSMIDQLKKGDTIPNVPPIYYMLFRPDVQPFLISCFRYDPGLEISRLNIPSLIVQGTTDIQVKPADAQRLAAGAANGELRMINNMNHVLKYFESMDKKEQIENYADTAKPLHPELVKTLDQFILSLQ